MPTTYTARAEPGPPTAEFPALRERGDLASWLPARHWPLVIAAGILLALGVLTWTIYGFVASHPSVAPLPARTLLHGTGMVLLCLAGSAAIAAVALVAIRRMLLAATERGVTEVHGLDPEVRAVDTHLSAIVGRLEAAVGQRVDGLDRRLESVEQQADEQDEQIQDLVTVAKVFATDSPNGQVSALHRPGGTGAGPPGRRPTGG